MPGARAEPHDVPALRAHVLGDRERREDVPAGAAGHDHERP